MTTLMLRAALSLFATASMLSAFGGAHAQPTQDSEGGEAMIVQYLEIVTPDVDAVCSTYEKIRSGAYRDYYEKMYAHRLGDGGKA